MEILELIKNRQEFVDAQIKNGFDLTTVLVDLYSDISHFVYEILQNAEDAFASEIIFNLFNDKLVIEHDGVSFTPSDIDAISSISNVKNLKKNNPDSIGKFGIGFKSVYNITESPRIQSGKYDFEVRYLVLPCNFSDNNSFQSTIITLPFNTETLSKEETFDIIKNKFQTFETYNLLYLTNLKSIIFKWEGETKYYSKKEKLIIGDIPVFDITISDGVNQNLYLVFKSEIKNEKFAKLKNKLRIAIAFKYTKSEGVFEIVKPDSSCLFAFFETNYETFLNFLVQAPFTTTPARDNIDFKLPVNVALLDEVCELIKLVLEYFSQKKLITINLLENLPINNQIGIWKVVYWKLFNAVKEEFLNDKKYLPVNDGKLYVSASSVGLIRGKELKQILASKKDLQMLFGIDYWLDSNITTDKTPGLRTYLMKVLNIKEYGSDDFARVVTKEFFESKQNTWVRTFYGFLNGKQQSLYATGRGRNDGILRNKEIIRLTNGKHTKPFDSSGKPKVFLPVSKKKVPYDIVNSEVISNKPSLEFIKNKLGIKEPDLLDEVRQHILPLYRTGLSSYPVNKKHLSDIEFIIDVYSNGTETIKSELIELIKAEGIFFFQAQKLNTGINYYARAEICYLPDEQLKEYFRNSENVYFLNDELYQSVSLELLHDIAKRCGAVTYVRKVSFDPHFSLEKKRQLRLDSIYKSDDITWGRGDRTTDYTLEGFNNIFKNHGFQKKDSVLIWDILLNFLKYNSKSDDLFKGVYWWMRFEDRFAYFPSQILLDLNNTKWLYGADDICYRPDEVTLSSLSIDYSVSNPEARYLIEKLQFKTEAENEYLNRLPEEKRIELLEAAELIRLSKEAGIDYKTYLQQRISEEKRAEYEAEIENAPEINEVIPVELGFEGFDNSEIEVITQEFEKENGEDQDVKEKNSSQKGSIKIPEQLPQDIKNKIGARGELIVFNFLKKKWEKKHLFLRETMNEMEFENKEGESFTITLLNETDKKGIGCDILIKMGEQIHKYIEVKSTKTNGKEYYSVSGYQWSLAYKNYSQSVGNNYSIYIVTNVLNEKPTITVIDNPIKKWKDGKLRAHPVNIEF